MNFNDTSAVSDLMILRLMAVFGCGEWRNKGHLFGEFVRGDWGVINQNGNPKTLHLLLTEFVITNPRERKDEYREIASAPEEEHDR